MHRLSFAACLAAAALCAGPAQAAINSVLVSNVDAYFGSQKDAYQDRFPLSLLGMGTLGALGFAWWRRRKARA